MIKSSQLVNGELLAARSGNLDLVKMLCERRTHKQDDLCIIVGHAISRGHMHIAEWFITQYKPIFTDLRNYKIICKRASVENLKYYESICPNITPDYESGFIKAYRRRNIPIVNYLEQKIKNFTAVYVKLYNIPLRPLATYAAKINFGAALQVSEYIGSDHIDTVISDAKLSGKPLTLDKLNKAVSRITCEESIKILLEHGACVKTVFVHACLHGFVDLVTHVLSTYKSQFTPDELRISIMFSTDANIVGHLREWV